MMSVALSSADEDVIQRIIVVPSESDRTPRDTLKNEYALETCLEWVIGNDFKRIALQFPDSLLGDSVSVCQILEESSQRRFFILGDTTYASCCVDEIAAEHAACDSIIHFGPSCLSPTSRLPVALVFPSCRKFDLENFSAALNNLVTGANKLVDFVLLYDTAHFSVAAGIQESLPANVTISKLLIPKQQTVICGDSRNQSFLQCAISVQNLSLEANFEVSRRSFPSPADPSDLTFVYIGSTGPCMINLFLQLASSPFYCYDPAQKQLNLQSPQINKRIMRRFYLIERAKDAEIVGILVGTLGVKDFLEIIERLKKMIKAAGKRFYTFSMGKPNPAKLANFMEVDVFVYVACPESFFDSKEYLKPVLTPHEMEIACGQRPIDEAFVPDFRNLLPGGTAHIEIQRADSLDSCPDVSLISGKARVSRWEEPLPAEASNELVLLDRILTVSTQPSATDFLSNRLWKGLQPHYGQDAPGEIVEGRHGIALSYTSEATIENEKVNLKEKDGCCGKCGGDAAADVSLDFCDKLHI